MLQEKEIIIPIIEKFQRSEITEYQIYKRLAKSVKDPENRAIIDQIAEEELHHSNAWKK